MVGGLVEPALRRLSEMSANNVTTKLTKRESGTKNTKKRSLGFVCFEPFGIVVSRISWLRVGWRRTC
jgi:hypothetical protein